MQFLDYINTLKIAVTPLRKDILSIFWFEAKPLKAYTILNQLKQKRPSAKPPTVYRVLEFLVQENIAHRIEATQSYVLCLNQIKHEQSKQVLMICNKCRNINEVSDASLQQVMYKLAQAHQFHIDSSVIELYGSCKLCLHS